MEQYEVAIPSGGSLLEGRLLVPGGPGPFPAVVLCHPHPLYGGDMYNPVIEHTGQALLAGQMVALKFNSRGTGRSPGAFDHGVGEVADALSALDYLGQHPAVQGNLMGIAGYSFGAGIALDATEANPYVRAVASIACPAAPLNDLVLHRVNRPKLFVQGDADHLMEVDLFRFLVQRFRPPREIEVLEGADHGLAGYETRVGNLVGDFLKESLL